MFPSYLGNPGIVVVILAIVLAWLLGLTWYLLRAVRHYQRLTAETSAKSLQEVLDSLLKKQDKNDIDIENLVRVFEAFQKHARTFVQHIGFVRFNPFEETGGDQSFVVAFLDAYKNGLVISSLHTRTGTRIYAKTVLAGKGIKHTLSKEEEAAVAQAVENSGQ